MTRKARKAQLLSLQSAIRSFSGHLEGTGKSEHTIDNYRWDLRQFEKFLIQDTGAVNPAQLNRALRRLSVREIEKFGEYLKGQGQKANTRRRRMLTVRKFVRYIVARKKLDIDVATRVPAPLKVERIPHTISPEDLATLPMKIPNDRDRALIHLLIETGCRVSEAVRLRWEDVKFDRIELGSESARRFVRISSSLKSSLAEIHRLQPDSNSLFTSRRGGQCGFRLSTRAVELLFQSYSARLGIESFLPRTLRHSVILRWLQTDVSTDEIKRRLGLKSDYAFRAYRPLLGGS